MKVEVKQRFLQNPPASPRLLLSLGRYLHHEYHGYLLGLYLPPITHASSPIILFRSSRYVIPLTTIFFHYLATIISVQITPGEHSTSKIKDAIVILTIKAWKFRIITLKQTRSLSSKAASIAQAVSLSFVRGLTFGYVTPRYGLCC